MLGRYAFVDMPKRRSLWRVSAAWLFNPHSLDDAQSFSPIVAIQI
jgi:hypothetical protein